MPASSCYAKPGLWVAVLGPDGAGKSAAIHRLTQELSLCFREIQRFHFRPMFRRRCQDSPPVTNPHGKPPRSSLLTIFKLLYWLADYWYGYVAIIRPALPYSNLIFFDRYYHDLLADPRRYRLPVSTMWLARFCARLVPTPDLYIVLDVPADDLQQRKPEVTLEESRRQRLAYLQMVRSMPNAFIIDAACPLDNVVREMKSVILTTPASGLQDRTGVPLIARP
jgi:thymidylate kinase